MNKIILNSCIVLLLFSCALEQKDVYYKVDPKTKIQFKQGDTLLFKSVLRTDTFKISSISDDYKVSDKLNHQEFFCVYYEKINFIQNEDSIFKDASWYNITRTSNSSSIVWRNLYQGYYNKTDTILKIANITISNVSVQNDSSKTNHYINDIKRVWFCNLYGVIEYERYSGEKFILDSTCF